MLYSAVHSDCLRYVKMGCGLLSIGLAAGAAYILYNMGFLSLPWSWIVAISAFTLLVFKYDKLRAPAARSGTERIPEKALLLLALIGGTPGAVLGIYLPPRHKTSKGSFKLKLLIVVAVQIAVLYFAGPQIHL
jgi:uncharacterized membrane protein YsdA (DUF1294 family)